MSVPNPAVGTTVAKKWWPLEKKQNKNPGYSVGGNKITQINFNE
jgi:hypothetical protein